LALSRPPSDGDEAVFDHRAGVAPFAAWIRKTHVSPVQHKPRLATLAQLWSGRRRSVA
jgi:hypothetical protein